MSSPWDLSKLFSPPSSDASSGVSIPAINTPELKPSINLPPDGNSWQREALQSAGLIPLVPITDNLLKTQSPISAWQQTNTNSFNPTVQQTNTFKFAIQEQTQPETNQWLAPSQTAGASSNEVTEKGQGNFGLK